MGGGAPSAWAPPPPLEGSYPGRQHPAAAALLPVLEAAAAAHIRALAAQLLATEGEGTAVPPADAEAWAPILVRLAGEAAALLLAGPARAVPGGLALDPRACVEVTAVDDGGGGRPADSTVEAAAAAADAAAAATPHGVRARLCGLRPPSSPPALLPALAAALRQATYAAWRCAVEAAYAADGLAAAGAAGPGRVVPAAGRGGGGGGGAASLILSASPHTSYAGGAAPSLTSFAASQRLWVCAMVSAPGGGCEGAPAAGAPCAPPRLARLPFYSAEPPPPARADPAAWPARPDVTLLAFVERAFGNRGGGGGGGGGGDAAPSAAPSARPPTPSPLPPPHAPVCGRPDCCAGPGEHAHTWWHGTGRVDLTVARLPATEALGGEGWWWVWRGPPLAGGGGGGEGGRGGRVPLSPAASALSLAHALDLAFNAPGLAEAGGRRAVYLGRGRDVARLAWRLAPPPALALPAGPVRPAPPALAAWLRAEAGRLVRDGNAALRALATALDALLAGGGGSPPPPAAVADAARSALARSAAGLGVAAAAACAAVDAAVAAASAGDDDATAAAAATTAAVSALGAARRALAKAGCTWAAHLWEGERLWAASEAGEAAVAAAERGAGAGAAPAPAPAPPPSPPSRAAAFARWLRRRRRRSANDGGGGGGAALRGWPAPVGGGGGGGLSSGGGGRGEWARRPPLSLSASPPPTALSGELLASVQAVAAAVRKGRKGEEEEEEEEEDDGGGWAAAVVAPCGGRAGRAAVAAGVAAALAAGDRPAALALASLGARLADPPSADALARLRDPPPGSPAAAGCLALPGGPGPAAHTTPPPPPPAVRVGGRALLPAGALPITVRDDDPATAVAHALASPGHAAFVRSVAGRALVDATLSDGGGRGGGDAAAAHYDSATADDSPGPGGGRAEVRVRAWWAPHFARVRAQTGAFPAGEAGDAAFAAALSRSAAWSPAGGASSKSGAAFARSADGSLLLKAVSRAEARSFEGLAPTYFRAVLGGRDRPTALARVLGLYTVTTARASGGGGGGGGEPAGGPASPPPPVPPLAGAEAEGGGGASAPEAKPPPPPPPAPPSKAPAILAPARPGEAVDFIVVENVFRGRGRGRVTAAAAFDLKGAASAARAAAAAGPPTAAADATPDAASPPPTLLDRDLLARSAAGEPLTLAAADAAVLAAALSADARDLAGGGVMDFSLLAGLLLPPSGAEGGDDSGGVLAVGLVDWLRPYSLAARVERWAKAAVVADEGPAAPPAAVGALPHHAHPADAPPAAGSGTVQAPARYAARFASAVPAYFAAVPSASGADPPPPAGAPRPAS